MAVMDWAAGIAPGTTQNVDPLRSGVTGSAGVTLGLGTGRLGQQPITGDIVSDSNPFRVVWTWLNTPFKQPLSPSTLFLAVGVILVAVIAWNLILYHVRIAAETI